MVSDGFVLNVNPGIPQRRFRQAAGLVIVAGAFQRNFVRPTLFAQAGKVKSRAYA